MHIRLQVFVADDRIGSLRSSYTENKTAENLCALCLQSNHIRLVPVRGPTPLFWFAAAEYIRCFQRHLPNPTVSPLQFICTMKALDDSNWKTTRNASCTSHENCEFDWIIYFNCATSVRALTEFAQVYIWVFENSHSLVTSPIVQWRANGIANWNHLK